MSFTDQLAGYLPAATDLAGGILGARNAKRGAKDQLKLAQAQLAANNAAARTASVQSAARNKALFIGGGVLIFLAGLYLFLRR